FVDGHALFGYREEASIALVTDQRLWRCFQLLPEGFKDGFPVRGILSRLALVSAYDVADAAHLDLFHLERRWGFPVRTFRVDFLKLSLVEQDIVSDLLDQPHPDAEDVGELLLFKLSYGGLAYHPPVSHYAEIA